MADLRTVDPAFFPFADALYQLAKQYNLGPVVTSAYRSTADQARLYRRYQQGLSRFPANPPGRSLHEYGLAFDMDLKDESNLPALGAAWQSLGPGFQWGGKKDPVHFEFDPR